MPRKILVSILTFPLLITFAVARSSAQEVSPDQTALIKATCTNVMRLQEGEAQWAGCVSSLSDSAASEVENDKVVNAGQSCLQKGSKRGTPEFSVCVLDYWLGIHGAQLMSGNEAAAQAPTTPIKLDYSTDPSREASESYFESSPGERHRKEEYSCAQLRLDPDSSQFTQCVIDLDATLFTIDHPND